MDGAKLRKSKCRGGCFWKWRIWFAEGELVKRTVSIPVGEGLLGRTLNVLGVPIDVKDPIKTGVIQPGRSKSPRYYPKKNGFWTYADRVEVKQGKQRLL